MYLKNILNLGKPLSFVQYKTEQTVKSFALKYYKWAILANAGSHDKHYEHYNPTSKLPANSNDEACRTNETNRVEITMLLEAWTTAMITISN